MKIKVKQKEIENLQEVSKMFECTILERLASSSPTLLFVVRGTSRRVRVPATAIQLP